MRFVIQFENLKLCLSVYVSNPIGTLNFLAEKKRGPRPETLDCTPPDYIMPGSKERPLLPLHPVDKDMKVTNIFLLSLKCLKKNVQKLPTVKIMLIYLRTCSIVVTAVLEGTHLQRLEPTSGKQTNAW